MPVLPIGIDNFERLRKQGGYYIDKTSMIRQLVQEHLNEVTLFTRPRRFGKTLTMKMLESFFDIRRQKENI